MILAIAATASCIMACAVLVAAEAAGLRGRRARAWAKTTASAAFVAVGLAGDGPHGAGSPATWIVLGLVLGAIGDVLLLSRARFIAGLVAFLCGHLAYIVAFALVVPIAAWPRLAPIPAMTTVCAGAAALAWLWPHAGPRDATDDDHARGSLRGPVIAYVLVIVTMVLGAMAIARAAPWSRARVVLVTTGAVLFFASDLAVARDRFVRPGFVNRAWGLPVYYTAQLAIAWSLIVA